MAVLAPRAVALAAVLALIPAGRPAVAQVPPSSTELAAYTGLHAAAAQGDIPTIERLLASGASLEARDSNRRTPLHVAVFARRHDAARTLLRLRADANALEAQKYDIITIASVQNDVPMLQIALAGGGNAKAITSPYNGTALIAAAHLGHAEVVRTLIAAGAPLDHVNNLGWTALMEAVVLGDGGPGHTACVEALVAAGARPIPDRQGRTPLDHARQRGYAAMVRILEGARPR